MYSEETYTNLSHSCSVMVTVLLLQPTPKTHTRRVTGLKGLDNSPLWEGLCMYLCLKSVYTWTGEGVVCVEVVPFHFTQGHEYHHYEMKSNSELASLSPHMLYSAYIVLQTSTFPKDVVMVHTLVQVRVEYYNTHVHIYRLLQKPSCIVCFLP